MSAGKRRYGASWTVARDTANCKDQPIINTPYIIQGSPSGGGHVPPGGDASRMTTFDDEVFMQKVYIGGMRSGKNVDNIRYHRHLEEEG